MVRHATHSARRYTDQRDEDDPSQTGISAYTVAAATGGVIARGRRWIRFAPSLVDCVNEMLEALRRLLTDHGGAIPPNVLTISNTVSTDDYRKYCMSKDLKLHPARMAPKLAEFFIKFLTDASDLVLDPFAGSNTTGAQAEELGRRWISVEMQSEYVKGSVGWFAGSQLEFAA
jgi:hypothetical protein